MFLADMFNKKTKMPEKGDALPGREAPIIGNLDHHVNGKPIQGSYPDGLETAIFGMGCFWGVERLFWPLEGVHVTAVGYAGGHTPNPTYQETVTGLTGHTEVVRVVFDPAVISYDRLLTLFWENHDPTQGMRQGNDVGSTYRSAIYATTPGQEELAFASREAYQDALDAAGRSSKITTEIRQAPEFYFAEEYHQQYLAKNPGGYCNMRGTGVSCAAPETAAAT